MKYSPDMHFWILIIIIIIMGAFGGFLNHLHNFDTIDNEQKNKYVKYKYVFLGIGAAALVPAFLKMISSDLIKNTKDFDNNSFLIFGGFCLIAAVFSRRFITTIGERILEAAKKAETISIQNKEQIESTKKDLSTTQERIEDVKASVGLNYQEANGEKINFEEPKKVLFNLVDNYIAKTSISDYSERLKLKAEIGRKMGQIIVRNNLSKKQLLSEHPEEGMFLALAYAIELKPDNDGLLILNEIASLATQLYTKYVILVGYRTLASGGIISSKNVKEVVEIVNKFKNGADKPLMRNIRDTLSVLSFINSEAV